MGWFRRKKAQLIEVRDNKLTESILNLSEDYIFINRTTNIRIKKLVKIKEYIYFPHNTSFISRDHASIEWRKDLKRYILKHLAISRKGVSIFNNKRLKKNEEIVLENNDQFSIGAYTFQIIYK